MKEAKFKLGQTVQTRGIYEACQESPDFLKEVQEAFFKYISCDWGDLCEDDQDANNSAVENNDDRILAKYNTSKGGIYIITEWDRSATTILFCNEY